MGRLVLQLPDGTSLDIPLDRERVTLGRRADNDVCLPFPAVSGEHAAVVTILDDSFLEDLNSTNGTLVNGKSISKHFLRDGDEIEIGRQKLVYRAGDAAIAAGEETPVRSGRTVRNARLAARSAVSAAARAAASRGPGPKAGSGDAAQAPPPSRSPGGPHAPAEPASRPREPLAVSAAEARRVGEPRKPADARGAEAAPAGPVSAGGGASVRIDTGPSAGRVVAMTGDRLVIGRVGERVVAIERTRDRYRLVPVEGEGGLAVNDGPVPADGLDLHAGDTLVVAGTHLTFTAPA